MTTIRARQPTGIPVGGQFASGSHSEGALTLPQQWDIIPDLIDLTPETEQVLGALRAAGGRPLIVGGAVRDGLLARTQGGVVDSLDIDIEVYGLSKEGVRKALPGEVNEFGQEFGVFNTSLNGQDFDVALPRQDNKTGEGHRGFVVETDPDMPFEIAFARRDFTMNAMGWDSATGEIVDPLGGGPTWKPASSATPVSTSPRTHYVFSGVSNLLGGSTWSWRPKQRSCARRWPLPSTSCTRTASGSNCASSAPKARISPRRSRRFTPPAGSSTSRAWPRPAASPRTLADVCGRAKVCRSEPPSEPPGGPANGS
jgi:hypothetical protein